MITEEIEEKPTLVLSSAFGLSSSKTEKKKIEKEEAKNAEKTIEIIEKKVEKSEKTEDDKQSKKSLKGMSYYLIFDSEIDFNDAKAFAASHGISFKDLILNSIDFVKSETEDGSLTVTRHGIKKNK